MDTKLKFWSSRKGGHVSESDFVRNITRAANDWLKKKIEKFEMNWSKNSFKLFRYTIDQDLAILKRFNVLLSLNF